MKRATWVWIAATCSVLAVIFFFSRGSLLGPQGGTDNPAPARAGAPPNRAGVPPAVGVGHPKRIELPTTLSLTASIHSLREAGLSSKVTGYLQAVLVRSGDPVRAGQVVAVVEHAQLDAQLAQAQAGLLAAESAVQTAQASMAAAKADVQSALAGKRRAEADLANAHAGLAKAQASLTNAKASNARFAELYRQGFVSKQALDDSDTQVQSAQASVDAARAQVNVAEAQVAQADSQLQAARAREAAATSQVRTQQAQAATAEATLENARLTVANATIRAPWSGVVTKRSLDSGAYVTATSAVAIVTIADLDQIDVLVNVAEAQMAAVRRGNPVEVAVDAYPERTFRGVVSRMAGGVDPDTRTLQVEIDIPNPGHLLRPGMYARVSLAAGQRQALVVPLGAMVTLGSQQFVWVVRNDLVARQFVTVGQATGDSVEITSGLREDDLVVIRGTDLVRDGGQVRAVPVGD